VGLSIQKRARRPGRVAAPRLVGQPLQLLNNFDALQMADGPMPGVFRPPVSPADSAVAVEEAERTAHLGKKGAWGIPVKQRKQMYERWVDIYQGAWQLSGRFLMPWFLERHRRQCKTSS